MKVALRSTSGRYLCAENGGDDTGTVHANRTAQGPWEEWELIPLDAGRPALWAGSSDFRLAQRQMAGDDIRPILEERKALGATILRVFAMKANNTGWDLIPQLRADYFGDVRRFFDTVASFSGMRIEWTVFADTALLPAMDKQLFWGNTITVARDYPFVWLELCNEWNHPTQRLNPQEFGRPDGIMTSHGSGQTDCDPVAPRWDFATYHARRDGARGFTNYDPYEFQSVYPQPCPLIPDEGAKPQNYGHNPDYARQMGLHAACGWGGTFHSDAGVDSRLFSDDERACAQAFFQGVNNGIR